MSTCHRTASQKPGALADEDASSVWGKFGRYLRFQAVASCMEFDSPRDLFVLSVEEVIEQPQASEGYEVQAVGGE